MRRAVQGFTLVEMLVGLGLTVFFMLMTLPSASAYRREWPGPVLQRQ